MKEDIRKNPTIISSDQFQEIYDLHNKEGIPPSKLAFKYGVQFGRITEILECINMGFTQTFVSEAYKVWLKENPYKTPMSVRQFEEKYANERGWSSYTTFIQRRKDLEFRDILVKNLSLIMKELAMKLNLTHTPMGAKIGLSESQVSTYISGKNLPNKLEDLLSIFEVSNQELDENLQYKDDLAGIEDRYSLTEARFESWRDKIKDKNGTGVITIGNYLLQVIEDRGLTVSDVAKMIPISEINSSTIATVFKSKFNGTHKYLETVCRALGISTAKIAGIRSSGKI